MQIYKNQLFKYLGFGTNKTNRIKITTTITIITFFFIIPPFTFFYYLDDFFLDFSWCFFLIIAKIIVNVKNTAEILIIPYPK